MSSYQMYIDLIRVALSLTMLVYGSYKELKTRMIHDLPWVVFGTAGLILDMYELYTGTLGLRQLLFSVGFMAAAGFLLGFLRLLGGADLLAFFALAVLNPKAPVYLIMNWGWEPIFYPFTLISNTAIAGAITPLYIALRNLNSKLMGVDLFERHDELSPLMRLGLLFTAVNVSLDKVKGPPFQYPLENPRDGSVSLRPNIWDDEWASEDFKVLRERGDGRVWVSFTLPYLLVILAGYLISVVFGDVLFWFFLLLM